MTTETSRQVIRTDSAPGAIGPYSQAIAWQSAGPDRWVFTSGQIALDPATGELVPGEIEDETRQVLKNLGAVLEAAGASFESVLKTTIYLADMGDFARVNAIYGECFSEAPPARSTVAVKTLPKNVRVEIDAIAMTVTP